MNKSILIKYSGIILSSSILIYCLKKYFISENDKNRLNSFTSPPTPTSKSTIKITNIIIYPIKACGGVELNECKLTKYGFENDRRWMIIKDNRYCAQKQFPVLATIKTSYSKDGKFLIVSKEGFDDLKVSMEQLDSSKLDESRIYRQVAMFDNTSQCYDQGDECSTWFEKVMGVEGVRFVQMCPDDLWSRPIRQHMAENVNKENLSLYKNSLANSCQLMMLSSHSAEFVNQKIHETRVKNNEDTNVEPFHWNRYRPNILYNGDITPFSEDTWKSIKIQTSNTTDEADSNNSNSVDLTITDANARCPVVTIDQSKGTFDQYDEPLRTLKTFRKVTCKIGEKVLLGTYAVIDEQQYGKSISVGDLITVTKTGFKSNYFSEIIQN